MNASDFQHVHTNPKIEGMPPVFAGGESWTDLDDARWLGARKQKRASPMAIVGSKGDVASVVTSAERAYSAALEGSSNPVLGPREQSAAEVSLDLARRRWLRLKESHFSREGRRRRIEAAVKALDAALVDYNLDAETARWIAEDADLEDM